MTGRRFSCAGARSGSLVAGVGIALSVETLALHLWLAPRHPLVAWALTLASISTLWWLVSDHRAMADAAVVVEADMVRLQIGRRFAATFPRSAIARAEAVGWRDVPEVAPPQSLNATKPAEPNVRLSLQPAVTVRMFGAIDRPVLVLGLHMDQPTEFLAHLSAPPVGHSLAQTPESQQVPR